MSLNDVWDASAATPFEPVVGKSSQFIVGFSLLLSAVVLSGYFGLNRSLVNIPLVGIPASLAFGFGAVYMICAVGVSSALSIVGAMSNTQRPMFTAVSSSVRHLTQILKCISLSSKAHAQISDIGIRFSVQESRVMQGFAFLQKELFSSYQYVPASSQDDHPILQISLESLLETLQIFGLNESSNRWSDNMYGGMSSILARGDPSSAFDNRILGTAGICKLSYARVGAPLDITLEETGITTTCQLTAYEPDLLPDIPFDKTAIIQKIIIRSDILLDAINELASTSPERITMTASSSGRHFSLSSDGPHGSATVEFSPDPQVLETFEVGQRVVNTYKYTLIKATNRAMAMASKVSIRVDLQGVLSLQFLIELETGLKNFIDFRFIPYLEEEDEQAGTQDTNDFED